MIYRYGIYCSGNAGRVLSFYKTRKVTDYQVGLVYYDGNNISVISELKELFGDNLVVFENNDGLYSNRLSELISNSLLYHLQKNEIDYLFCFGSSILKKNLIGLYHNRIINFHPSILPAFPGIKAIDQALATSVQFLGNTAHFIDEGIDSGPIIMQTVIRRSSFSSYEDVLSLQLTMLEKIWFLLERDRINVINNNVSIDTSQNGTEFFISL